MTHSATYWTAPTAQDAAKRFALARRAPGWRWEDEEAGTFRLDDDPKLYRTVQFGTGYAVFLVLRPSLPGCA